MTAGLSVLIVDDDPASLQMLQAILRDAGFVVRTTERPTAALRDMVDHSPDLLLTDLRMPEMSGLELIRAARRLRPDLCCLLITAFATDEATADAFRAGAWDLLLKPINVEEVRARVFHAVEVVLLRREVRALRAAQTSPAGGHRSAGQAGAPADRGSAPRARELEDLPALPGSAAPVEVSGREEIFGRLERLGVLLRQGVITPAEFEEKKRVLLARI